MNLRDLPDRTLLERTEGLVKREREVLTEILHHLREIERRRLFSELGFKSLFDYATKKLGYADDQAARRISAMRLLKELPQIEEKVASGALSLTNLNLAQTLFRQEQKAEAGFSQQEKLKLLAQLENQPKREAEKIILSRSSEPIRFRPDRVRQVSETTIEIKFMADSELQLKLERIKGLLAHSHPNMSLAEAVNYLCDLGIKNLDPSKKPGHGNSRTPVTAPAGKIQSLSAPDVCLPDRKLPESKLPRSKRQSPAPALKRRISVSTRREVWRSAGSKCQNCGSAHALQIDHIQPIALGGENDRQNLRLLCRSCNQRTAITKLGFVKMERFFRGPER